MDTYGWIKNTDYQFRSASAKAAEANAIRAFWRGMAIGAMLVAAGSQLVIWAV